MTVEPRVEPRLLLQPTAVIRCRGVCRSVGSSCGADPCRHLASPSRHPANASGRPLVRLRDGRQGWRRSRVYRRACAEPVESKASPAPASKAPKCIRWDEMCLWGEYPTRSFGPHVNISQRGRGPGCGCRGTASWARAWVWVPGHCLVAWAWAWAWSWVWEPGHSLVAWAWAWAPVPGAEAWVSGTALGGSPWSRLEPPDLEPPD